jgi:hypothetical protein
MKVQQTNVGKIATLHFKIMETTGIKISTHPYKYIKRTTIHPSVD